MLLLSEISFNFRRRLIKSLFTEYHPKLMPPTFALNIWNELLGLSSNGQSACQVLCSEMYSEGIKP